jgi:16S rRNA (uracil1498-N3)-methyltransferase
MRTERTPARRARLFVTAALECDTEVSLSSAQAHYLRNVLRAALGDRVEVFNAREGAFVAAIETMSKKTVTLRLESHLRAPDVLPALWLAFAPLRRERMDFLIEKAVELGVTRLCPVVTRFTQSHRLKPEHIEARMIEACEQSERVGVVEIAPLTPLDRFLSNLPAAAQLVFCDEAEAATGGVSPIARRTAGPQIVLIGPEGGFHEDERSLIASHAQVVGLSLGPRILRAETAAIAALSLMQVWTGDWGR